MTVQKILQTDSYYVDYASDEGRLFLVRTIGSLSGGTRVKVVGGDPNYDKLQVSGKVVVEVKTAPFRKTVEHVVEVTLDDLVIRRMACHPDALNKNQPRPRAERRREIRGVQNVLANLKRESQIK
jgi:hypothetical protein